MTIALASSAFAGAPAPSGKGGKMIQPVAPSCDWFAPGAKFGANATGFFEANNSDNSAAGGGVLAEYFFTENFGVEGSANVFSTEQTHWQFDLNLVARLPMMNGCWAPYIMGGGGYTVNSVNDWTLQAGAGVEVHLTGKMGLFADGAYHWSEGPSDFTMVRLGLKFRL